MPVIRPTLRLERALLRSGHDSLACIDEAGRGALCGPVSVGVVVITASTRTAPTGLADSKLLTPQRRQELVPRIQRWAAASAVGMASAGEIDRIGIIAALRLAGHRALGALATRPAAILLDGNHDYLKPPPQGSLLDLEEPLDQDGPLPDLPPVVTQVKADLRCAGVAAASVLAKTARDAVMVDLAPEHPEYGWAGNKGYAAPDHLAALRRLGPTAHHRVSWRLPA